MAFFLLAKDKNVHFTLYKYPRLSVVCVCTAFSNCIWTNIVWLCLCLCLRLCNFRLHFAQPLCDAFSICQQSCCFRYWFNLIFRFLYMSNGTYTHKYTHKQAWRISMCVRCVHPNKNCTLWVKCPRKYFNRRCRRQLLSDKKNSKNICRTDEFVKNYYKKHLCSIYSAATSSTF